MVWGAAIAGGAQVLGGLLGRSGQRDANAANERIARDNKAFQERMSSTAYQRAAKDLDAAGLNRILAIGSPSSTPAGSVATMQNENKPVQEGITGGVASALVAARLKAEIGNINARTNLTNAQKDALTPAAKVGQGVGGALTIAERNLSPNNVDYGSMWDTTAQMAKDNIARVAESVGLKGGKTARSRLIETMSKMDIPGFEKMSRAEKLTWADNNRERIQRYLQRQKQ